MKEAMRRDKKETRSHKTIKERRRERRNDEERID